MASPCARIAVRHVLVGGDKSSKNCEQEAWGHPISMALALGTWWQIGTQGVIGSGGWVLLEAYILLALEK